MAKRWIEVAALLIAAGSMLFSGYQTLLLRETITAPYRANLQDRQVDACIEVITEWARYTSKSTALEKLLDEQTGDVDIAIAAVEPVQAALTSLVPFAGPDALKGINWANLSLVYYAIEEVTESDWKRVNGAEDFEVKPPDKAMAPILSACRDVMTGERTGWL